MGMISELIAGRLYVTTPVTLVKNVEFIIVQSGHVPGHTSDIFAKEGNDSQQPDRCLDAYPPMQSKLVVKIITKGFALIDIAVGQKLFASRHSVVT